MQPDKMSLDEGVSRRGWRKLRNLVTNITVEPALLLFAICGGFFYIASKNLYIQKVCKVNLSFGEEVCDNIQNHTEKQVEVQKYVSTLKSYNQVLQAIPPCVLVLFSGPWSDKYGRKPLLISALFGYFLSNAIFFINTYFFFELKAEFLLFEAIQDMTGGSTVLYMSAYSYISDITSLKDRTTRFALMDGALSIGYYGGNALAGIVAEKCGVLVNFTLGMLFSMMAVLYSFFFIKDSRQIRTQRLQAELAEQLHEFRLSKRFEEADRLQQDYDESQAKEEAKKSASISLKQLVSIKNLKEGLVNVFFKQRKNGGRILIILIMFAHQLEWLTVQGHASSTYLYLRKVLKFDGVQYTRFVTASGLINLAGKYIVVPFLSKKLKWRDSTIALIDSVTSALNLVIFAFTVSEWMLYLGGVIAILDQTTATMFRSMISKLVSADEVGSVFSVLGLFQELVTFVAGPSFNYLYKHTVATFPAAFLFVVIGAKALVFVDIFIVHLRLREFVSAGKEELEVEYELKDQLLEEQGQGVKSLKEVEMKIELT